jgi:hypothetical protein
MTVSPMRTISRNPGAICAGMSAAAPIPKEFYLGLSELLMEIRCDHTKAGVAEAFLKQRKDERVTCRSGFASLTNRMYVDMRVGDGSVAR